MIRYRLLFVFAAALALAAPAAAAPAVTRAAGHDDTPRSPWLDRFQESRQGPEQTDKFSETYKVSGEGALDLNQVAGDVKVVTGRGNEVRIDAIKRVRHRDPEEAKRLLAALRIEVNQVGNRLEVRTVYPGLGGRGSSTSVDYTITVPASEAVSVKTVSGNVSVNAVRGEVRAETVSGDVEVVATPNLAVARAVSGDVHARDIGGPVSLTLGTVSGTVVATGLKVRTLDAGSVSGNLQLSNVEVERLTAKTVNGDIDFDGSLSHGGRYEFSAHSGGVRLVLANATGFDLDASTFSGSIRSDFPVTLRSSSGTGSERRGMSNRAIRGTFGDASAVLSIRSFSGSVVITKK
jgi:DUF4097 and DUF4098 domain-containing protein YvlB